MGLLETANDSLTAFIISLQSSKALPALVSSLEHRLQSLDTFCGYTIGTSHEWQMQTSFLSQRLAWYLDR
ncbi:hypothetical protein AFLA70_79g003760 [Aspergillus flavus AF70]|nr:hypothetical protein AFLA70_79g003760 [Aspergillus flavus AF70]